MAGGYADRCGPGPRQPLVVISPYAKKNYVDHTQTDQASILRFIEDNWQHRPDRRRLRRRHRRLGERHVQLRQTAQDRGLVGLGVVHVVASSRRGK